MYLYVDEITIRFVEYNGIDEVWLNQQRYYDTAY